MHWQVCRLFALDDSIRQRSPRSNLPAAQPSQPSNTTVKSGWVAGAGAEWMATSHILLRAEYLYYGLIAATVWRRCRPQLRRRYPWRSIGVGKIFRCSGLAAATSSSLREVRWAATETPCSWRPFQFVIPELPPK
jgi:hypothetical protein